MKLAAVRHRTSILSCGIHNAGLLDSGASDDDKIPVKKPLLYASLLQTCVKALSFRSGSQVHCHVVKAGLDADRFVGNSLLSLYFKLAPDFGETRLVFDNLPVKDVIAWTSMVSGYVRSGRPENALAVFGEMVESGVEPNAFTLSASVKACAELRHVRHGMAFHGMILRLGLDANCVIASSLIDMYGRSTCLKEARRMFDEMREPDMICWTTAISTLVRNDAFEEALKMFYLMQRDHSLFADDFTFGAVLTACGHLGWLRQGKGIHGKVVTSGFGANVVVESSLVDMYGKCGYLKDSRQVFDCMPTKNSVSWCALLAAYCQNGDPRTVLELFRVMEKEEDQYSFGMVLRACAGLAAVRQGKEVHCQYIRKGGSGNVIVESALVDLYAKCGSIAYACRVFDEVPSRNLITWNSMVSGFAQNGWGKEAIKLFNDMVKQGIRPDYISFIGVLFACSHSGLVSEGRAHFQSMKHDYGIEPGIEHYNCMVDLLGRAGLLEEAENLIEKSFLRDLSSLWAALLGACIGYSNMDMAERIAKKIMELEPNYHLSYTLLVNAYKAVGKWDEALTIRKIMEDRRIQKTPGRSWIEVKKKSLHLNSCMLVRGTKLTNSL